MTGIKTVATLKSSDQNSPTEILRRKFLMGSAAPELPLLVIDRIEQTSSVHILVVWDAWRELSIPERGRIMMDAYEQAFPKEAFQVRLTLGLTPAEALSQGYLKFQIVPLIKASDKVNLVQLKRAMSEVGGIVLKVGDVQQLRFLSREQANEAYNRLLRRINKPIWTLVEEMAVG